MKLKSVSKRERCATRLDKMEKRFFWFMQMTFNILAVLLIFILVLVIARDSYQASLKKSRHHHQHHQDLSEQVTLIGGSSSNEGNVFAHNYETGIKGPVCDDAWSLASAIVVCRQLGFVGALKFTQGSAFGAVLDKFSYNNVKCTGLEPSIIDCPHSLANNCDANEGAGVVCDPRIISTTTTATTTITTTSTMIVSPTTRALTTATTATVKLMLMRGTHSYEGNVYAMNPTTGVFGPVCDDFWSMKDAYVVCKALGFRDVIFRTIKSAFGPVNPNEYSFTNVFCTGSEVTLDACPHSNTVYCSAEEAAGAICDNGNETIILIGGQFPHEGNVFARNPAINFFGPVCDDNWGVEDAAVVCQQLGYNGVINFTLASTFGPVPSFYAFDNVNCSGKETSLNDCPHLNEDDCTSFEGAGVVCNTESSELVLRGGSSNKEGNVFMLNHKTKLFGPVCDDYWTMNGANVVCKQLGFYGALNFTFHSHFGYVPTLFAFDNVMCIGNESSLNDCPHLDDNDCNFEEGAGVVCGDTVTTYAHASPQTSSRANYTGMTKLMVVSGLYEKSVEIVNLDSNTQDLVCDNPPALPFSLDGAIAHLNKRQSPMVCGGYNGDYPICTCFLLSQNNDNATWINNVNTTTCRSYAASTVMPSADLNDTLLLVGGIGRNGILSSSEKMNQFLPRFETSASLPRALVGSCMVTLNDSTVFLVGGTNPQGGGPTTDTYFYSTLDNIWRRGPLMKQALVGRTCGLMNWTNQSTGSRNLVVVVAGGGTLQTELLFVNSFNANGTGWMNGPDLPIKIFGSKMVSFQNSVLLVGGWTLDDPDWRYIFQLDSPFKEEWIQLDQKLKISRYFHVAMLVPDTVVKCN